MTSNGTTSIPSGLDRPLRVERYALMMGAFNEERYIETTLRAVVAQTHLPVRWVIVDDCSSDNTPALVEKYARDYPFISLHRMTKAHPRDLIAHVTAVNAAYDLLRHESFDCVGNLDADVSFEPSYFGRLLQEFDRDPKLGIAGGCLYEQQRLGVWKRRSRSERSVPNAIQMFRRDCYEGIGGYRALKYGAPDWYAEVHARMIGWHTQSFPDLPAYHHRTTGAAGGILRNSFRGGLVAYTFGSHPLFEVLKSLRRIPSRPMVFGALYRIAGFVAGYLKREPRLVSPDFIQFLRSEQYSRMSTMIGDGLRECLPATIQGRAER